MKDPAARMRDVDAAFEGLSERLEKVPGVRHLGETDGGLRYSARVAGVSLEVAIEPEIHDDELWMRMTVAVMHKPERTVTWAELSHCKDTFLGRGVRAVLVMPERVYSTDVHALTLWAPLERDPLPDFGERTRGGHLRVT